MTKLRTILAGLFAVLASASAFSPISLPATLPAHYRHTADTAGDGQPSGGTKDSATALNMKVVHSIGSLKKRSATCQVVRRRGRIFVIDPKNPRNKARQGGRLNKKAKKRNKAR
mmetsp:Transcript_88530/g.253132  ORF Transcript_88530/g.253132 Transcript_88530/m.253132 type:complete len:114 (+) Transcript_88530:329-670(+)|eukprot:CAMPEP_0119507316 /NCGR_PEP_ID=MMETSP1344-20130328/27249_1 /TAXON_ID=236787 /ORGANISM="Florenciella parvula, Strain CCMP2471" /LENGTH=113 /DNA_ID=CAMNT_0007543941 /DNA_START=622 /DNA_END=963 /DNA_ORIENTATION=-